LVQHDGPSGPDSVQVRFDDERAVAHAGAALIATLAGRLGLEAIVDDAVDLGDRAGAGNEGAKVMTLVSAMALGADCIDDCDVLRSGRTADIVGHRVMAPSTLGTFLRSFTFGHVRQLDRVLAAAIQRAWRAGAGPGAERLIVDVDSFVGETFGRAKQGAAFGYTRVRGYHPILATRADSGEVLHIRLRTGAPNIDDAVGHPALGQPAERDRQPPQPPDAQRVRQHRGGPGNLGGERRHPSRQPGG
jgi:hypothetical protein